MPFNAFAEELDVLCDVEVVLDAFLDVEVTMEAAVISGWMALMGILLYCYINTGNSPAIFWKCPFERKIERRSGLSGVSGW